MRTMITMFLAALLVGCAVQAPSELRDQNIDDRHGRKEAFQEYTQLCNELGGYPVIMRHGRAMRRDMILRIPGEGDTVSCQARDTI